MTYQKCGDKYMIRIKKGEELLSTLTRFCKENQITAGQITGLGASNFIKLGLFDTVKKEYMYKTFSGQPYEISSMVGNISMLSGEPFLHIHVNISDQSFQVSGGHLAEGVANPTFEIILTPMQGKIIRDFEPEIGFNLMQLDSTF